MEKCKHNFVSEKYKTQELKNKYIGNSQYQDAIIENEKIKIFCTKCGESKDI